MQKKKYRRINFRINHCSSEDPEYPVSQLLLQSPNSKGWQSKRFCQYPQTIIAELVEPTVLKQISVLSHQSKIATKIVIHSKLDQNKEWERLGYISLESNVNTNYQSRQLKTVNIRQTHCLFLRFSLEVNYANNHNLFNQVGLVSLSFYGQKFGGDDQQDKPKKIVQGDFDKNTMGKLKALEIEKKLAIDEEDFDKAQSIKNEIQRIKKLGNTLMLLEEKKRKAIENENYDDAKVLNDKIKQLRDAEGGGPNFTTRPSGTPSDYFRPKKTQYEEHDEEYSEENSISPMTMHKKAPQLPPPKRRSPPKMREEVYGDERPINVKNPNPYENFQDEEQGKRPQNDDQPQRLTKQLYKQCSAFFPVFDEGTFMLLFSHNHAHRQKGLNYVRQEVMANRANRNALIEAFFYVIRKLIDDKNASVLLSTLDLFGVGIRKLKPQSQGHLISQCEYIMERMNDYLGHTNEKIKRLTEDIYVSLPTHKLTAKDLCYRVLTVVGKREKPPKILTGRLKTISDIVNNFQLGRNYDDVVAFAVRYADDKNSDVRNAAVALICSIANEIGYSNVQPFMKNLRPKIIETIEEKFHEKGGKDDRNFDERPIKPQEKAVKNPRNAKKEVNYEEIQNENQFIEVPKKKITNVEYICEFCQRYDKKFEDEDYRDLHLYNACPMLLICDQCKQAIEINSYTAHLVSQCKNSKYYKKCPRCKEAIHQRNYKTHVEKKECIPAQPLAAANRCPLCHLDIDPGKDGWITHLSKEGCDNNPRK